MKIVSTITIGGSGSSAYTLEATSTSLGRQWDNDSTAALVVMPSGQDGRVLTAIISAGGEVIDKVLIGSDGLLPIKNSISRFPCVRIGFAFSDGTDYLKTTQSLEFHFEPALSPHNALSGVKSVYADDIDRLLANAVTDGRLENDTLSLVGSSGNTIAQLDLERYNADKNSKLVEAVRINGALLTPENKTIAFNVPTLPSDIGAEPAFEKKSAFNAHFSDDSGSYLSCGEASAGSSNSVARADHVHPENPTNKRVFLRTDTFTIPVDITLPNAERFSSIKVYGVCRQNGTPAPSAPQEVFFVRAGTVISASGLSQPLVVPTDLRGLEVTAAENYNLSWADESGIMHYAVADEWDVASGVVYKRIGYFEFRTTRAEVFVSPAGYNYAQFGSYKANFGTTNYSGGKALTNRFVQGTGFINGGYFYTNPDYVYFRYQTEGVVSYEECQQMLADWYASGNPLTFTFQYANVETLTVEPIDITINLDFMTFAAETDGTLALSVGYYISPDSLDEAACVKTGTLAARPTGRYPYNLIYISTDQASDRSAMLPKFLSGSIANNWIKI